MPAVPPGVMDLLEFAVARGVTASVRIPERLATVDRLADLSQRRR